MNERFNLKRLCVALFLVLCLIITTAHSAPPKPGKFFPYPVNKTTLPNGLDVLIIETPEFKDMLSFNTLVLAGSRNELEKGKTGFAHLFEHIMFRHRFNGVVNGYDEEINKLGAFNNAFTWFDVTYYHPLTFTSNLETRTVQRAGQTETQPGLLELESSRFSKLDFDEKIFQTEAGAVLGEYRKSATQPELKMEETLCEMAFPKHSYGHTTIGYYEDVVDMPNKYQAAVDFYNAYYRPNTCVLIIAGDVKQAELLPKIQKHYGAWQKREVSPVNLVDPPQTAEKRSHIKWEAEVPPRLWVAFKMPAHRNGSVESAVGQLLPELLVSESAPLYQKLRYQKRTVSSLDFAEGTSGYESFDPRLLIINARLYKEKFMSDGKAYFEEVLGDVNQALEDLKRFSAQPDAAKLLEVIKSKYTYDFLAGLNSPAGIAQTLAWYYRFERDPQVLDKLLESVQKLRPQDFDAFAKKYFVPENRLIVTVSFSDGAP
ncbi:MAG: insulinase family protein [candidate division KSB1 bacterium]|nr:insulinase family protein [candidate division KSB1 bacterium]MDZ7301102.1 insulinase family protein [candidate division KSB1 bacterium]MDZ7312013.1 insulinase family protein [candidate division KSB1 bacterium]